MIFAEYRLIRKLGEGTFSEVLKAQSVQTGQYVAIKCMKSHFDSIDQVSLKSHDDQEVIHKISLVLFEN
jgi:serine/threonine protein kinase